MKTNFLGALCLSALLASAASAREPSRGTVLVLPARYTHVQLAFDVARMRRLTLVAYPPAQSIRTVHVWDNAIKEWVATAGSQYLDGTAFDRAPEKVILIGEDQETPESLLQPPAGCDQLVRIPSLKPADIINALTGELRLKPREVEWLSGRFGLKVRDENADRRRWGRYGPPGSRPVRPEPAPLAPSASRSAKAAAGVDVDAGDEAAASPVRAPAPAPAPPREPARRSTAKTPWPLPPNPADK